MTVSPALTLILTSSDNDAPAVAHSLDGLLALDTDAIELVLVCHGVDDATHNAFLNRADPRLRVQRMAPAPRAAARNRGLAHARGQRICVLEPGDTLAPFALPDILQSAADCLILPGVLRDDSGMVHASAGQRVFDWLVGAGLRSADITDARFSTLVNRLALIPPQPGCRVVSRALVQRHSVSFAHEGASGWLFATGALMNADSLAFADLPSVIHRQNAVPEPQDAFAALNDAAQALHLMQRARHFQDPALRLALLGAVFRQLGEVKAALPPGTQQGFDNACALMLARCDQRLLRLLTPEARGPIEAALAPCAPWLSVALDHALELSGSAGEAPARMARQSAIARLLAWRWGHSSGS